MRVDNVCLRNGNTRFIGTLSCDSVMDGAFFPQPDFQVPEKEVGQHARGDVMMPASKLSDFIVLHAQFGFGLLEALLNCPAQATEPDQRFKAPSAGGVGDEIAVTRELIGYLVSRELSIHASEVARRFNHDRSAVSRAAQRVGNDAELMPAAIKIMEQLHPGIKQR